MHAAYFLVDTTAPSFSAARLIAENANPRRSHRVNLRLSVAVAPGGARAVIKVKGANKLLISSPALITAYAHAEHQTLLAVMASIAPLEEWTNPD